MNNDLISREQTKDFFHDEQEYFGYVIKKTLDIVPTAKQPQGEWVPVSERLPERYKEVIVTDIETSDTYQSRYIGNGYWECDNGTLKNRIIAWQPLPEPYQEVKQE